MLKVPCLLCTKGFFNLTYLHPSGILQPSMLVWNKASSGLKSEKRNWIGSRILKVDLRYLLALLVFLVILCCVTHPPKHPTYCKTVFGLKVEVIEGESNFGGFQKHLRMLESRGMQQIGGKREEKWRDWNKLETQIRFRATSIEFHTKSFLSWLLFVIIQSHIAVFDTLWKWWE